MKIAIWGIGFCGRQFKRYCEICDDYEVVVAFDNSVKSQKVWRGIIVDLPENISEYEFEQIVITTVNDNTTEEIRKTIHNLGVGDERIIALYSSDELLEKVNMVSSYDESDARVVWLRYYAEMAKERGIKGEVAECGVNRGDFSMYINQYFSDKKLYLFDTFEGFAAQDLLIERKIGDKNFLDSTFNDDNKFNDACEQRVLARMPFKDNCEIRKGYFPDTAKGLENEKFCFVNLDMDLYVPQIEGLRFFFDRMSSGGVILLHDYFNKALPGVKRAVSDFINEKNEAIHLVPIGDGCSIAIIR